MNRQRRDHYVATSGVNLCIDESVPYMISGIGYGTYFLFAGMLTIGFFWTYFFLPETKGVPLEDMDRLFGGKTLTQQTEQREHMKAEQGEYTHRETVGTGTPSEKSVV